MIPPQSRCILRLTLLHRRGGRLLLDGGTCLPGTSTPPGVSAEYAALVRDVQDTFARFRAKHGLTPPTHTIQAQCIVQQQRQSGYAPPLSKTARPLGDHCLVIGEVLHIVRPVVYAAMLRRYGTRAWSPWVTSLVVELASMQLTCVGGRLQQRGDAAKGDASVQHPWSELEQRELMRRKMLLLYYLIRSPMYELATRRAVLRVQGVANYVPLLRSLVDKAVEILEGIQTYYTYTAAS